MPGERIPPFFFLTFSSLAGGLTIFVLGFLVQPWGELPPLRAAIVLLSVPWVCALVTAYVNRGLRGLVDGLRGFGRSAMGPLWLDLTSLGAAAVLAWLDADDWWAVLPWLALTWEGAWRGFVFERVADHRPSSAIGAISGGLSSAWIALSAMIGLPLVEWVRPSRTVKDLAAASMLSGVAIILMFGVSALLGWLRRRAGGTYRYLAVFVYLGGGMFVAALPRGAPLLVAVLLPFIALVVWLFDVRSYHATILSAPQTEDGPELRFPIPDSALFLKMLRPLGWILTAFALFLLVSLAIAVERAPLQLLGLAPAAVSAMAIKTRRSYQSRFRILVLRPFSPEESSAIGNRFIPVLGHFGGVVTVWNDTLGNATGRQAGYVEASEWQAADEKKFFRDDAWKRGVLDLIHQSDFAVVDLSRISDNVKWEIEQIGRIFSEARIQFVVSSRADTQAADAWLREHAPAAAKRALERYGLVEYGKTRAEASAAFWRLFSRLRELALVEPVGTAPRSSLVPVAQRSET